MYHLTVCLLGERRIFVCLSKECKSRRSFTNDVSLQRCHLSLNERVERFFSWLHSYVCFQQLLAIIYARLLREANCQQIGKTANIGNTIPNLHTIQHTFFFFGHWRSNIFWLLANNATYKSSTFFLVITSLYIAGLWRRLSGFCMLTGKKRLFLAFLTTKSRYSEKKKKANTIAGGNDYPIPMGWQSTKSSQRSAPTIKFVLR